MKSCVWASGLLILIGTTHFNFAGSKPVFTSVYTDAEDCRWGQEITGVEPENDDYKECKGIDGYYIHESYSASNTYKTIRHDSLQFHIDLSPKANCPTHAFGKKIEWRLADGKPFAIIYRIGCLSDSENEKKRFTKLSEYLIVRGLAGQTIAADFDTKRTANANEQARSAADAGFTRRE